MVLPGHLAAGYITTFLTMTTLGYSFTATEQTLLLTAGTLLGDAPDIDVFFGFIKNKSTKVTSLKGHRDHITHVPLLWLFLGLSIWMISTSDFYKTLGLLLWVCPWSHLICDSVFTDTGVRWFAPFTQKSVMFFQRNLEDFPLNWKSLFYKYAQNPLFYLELSLVVFALIILVYR